MGRGRQAQLLSGSLITYGDTGLQITVLVSAAGSRFPCHRFNLIVAFINALFEGLTSLHWIGRQATQLKVFSKISSTDWLKGEVLLKRYMCDAAMTMGRIKRYKAVALCKSLFSPKLKTAQSHALLLDTSSGLNDRIVGLEAHPRSRPIIGQPQGP